MVGILTLFILYVFVLCVDVCVSVNKNLPETHRRISCALFPCWNYKIACKHFEKEPRQGFVYSGQGPVTAEDLKNIKELIDEMMQ